MFLKDMAREKSIRFGWRCESCGELMSDLQAGWVEWVAAEDKEGNSKVSGVRLVHRDNTGARYQESYGCRYNARDEFRKNNGIVEGLPLDRFTGPDGLMLLLSMIAGSEFPVEEVIELAKRVQIPGYEAVYELAHDAVSEGVIMPSISSGFYLQCEIWDVMKWAKCRTLGTTSNVHGQNGCAASS